MQNPNTTTAVLVIFGIVIVFLLIGIAWLYDKIKDLRKQLSHERMPQNIKSLETSLEQFKRDLSEARASLERDIQSIIDQSLSRIFPINLQSAPISEQMVVAIVQRLAERAVTIFDGPDTDEKETLIEQFMRAFQDNYTQISNDTKSTVLARLDEAVGRALEKIF